MKLIVRHGHYAFYPRYSKSVSVFNGVFRQELKLDPKGFYTFPRLLNLPDYALEAKPYGNLPAIKTYEGEPWEIMREQGWVYNLTTEALAPITSISYSVKIEPATYAFIAFDVVPQAGGVNPTGLKLIDYEGELDLDAQNTLRIRELRYG